MTAYATTTDLARLGVSAGALANVSTLDQEAALLSASRKADGYFAARLQTPLQAWSEDVREVVAVVAAYALMSVRGFNPTAGGNQTLRDRYLVAIRWLEQVAKGQITPTGTDAGGAPSTSAVVRVASATPRGWGDW